MAWTARIEVFLLLVLASLLGACAHTYLTERTLEQLQPLAKGTAFYVALPVPGAIDGRIYSDSAEQTATSVAAALEPFAARTEVGRVAGDHQFALERAREIQADYAIVPIIERWEDRNTGWSGKSDRIAVRLYVLDVKSGRSIDSADISGKSRWFTLGGDHPEELLAEPVGDYIASLFE